MKKTIRGICYDTEADVELWQEPPGDQQPGEMYLRQTADGRFYIHTEFDQFHDGREWIPCPDGDELQEKYGFMRSDPDNPNWRARLRFIHTIRPVTYEQALAWFIKYSIPKVFQDHIRKHLGIIQGAA